MSMTSSKEKVPRDPGDPRSEFEIKVELLTKQVAQLQAEYDGSWAHLVKRSIDGQMNEIRKLKELTKATAKKLKRTKKRLAELVKYPPRSLKVKP